MDVELISITDRAQCLNRTRLHTTCNTNSFTISGYIAVTDTRLVIRRMRAEIFELPTFCFGGRRAAVAPYPHWWTGTTRGTSTASMRPLTNDGVVGGVADHSSQAVVTHQHVSRGQTQLGKDTRAQLRFLAAEGRGGGGGGGGGWWG